MKTYGEVEVFLHAFLISALDGDEWSASDPDLFTPRETAPGTHWIGGCGPQKRSGRGDEKKNSCLCRE